MCAIRDSYSELSPSSKHDEQLIQQRKDEINLYLLWDNLEEIPKVTHKRVKLGKEIYQNIFEKIVDNDIVDIDIKKMGDNEKRIFNNYKILKSNSRNMEILELSEVLADALEIKMEENDLFEELQHEEQDEEILSEIEARKKEAKKSFSSVVNKKKLSKYELDEVMV